MPTEASGGERDSAGLLFPHPLDASRTVAWNGDAFLIDGSTKSVLAYDVSPSGWTDELTQLHEEAGGSDHFIDVASRSHAIQEVGRCVATSPSTVLEIGCSSGFLLRELRERMPNLRIIGSDYISGPLEALAAKVPNIPLLQFDLTRCPLPEATVDVAVLLNVLEHIDDHEAAVTELYRILRPNGAAIIEVPAGSSLYDVYDRVLMHHRRYDMTSLVCLLEQVGFTIERRTHLGFALYPAFYLAKRLNQLRYSGRGDLDERELVARMISATHRSSRMMNFVMRAELALEPYIYFPVGVRCLATCRKPA